MTATSSRAHKSEKVHYVCERIETRLAAWPTRSVEWSIAMLDCTTLLDFESDETRNFGQPCCHVDSGGRPVKVGELRCKLTDHVRPLSAVCR